MKQHLFSPVLPVVAFGLLGLAFPAFASVAYQQIKYPGSSYTAALGVNSNGDVVGLYQVSSGPHGFLYSNGQYETLDDPGKAGNEATGINDNGDVVGLYIDSSGNTHGYTDIGGTFTSVDYPGAQSTYAESISNDGEVAGWYVQTEVPLPRFISGIIVQSIPIDPLLVGHGCSQIWPAIPIDIRRHDGVGRVAERTEVDCGAESAVALYDVRSERIQSVELTSI